MQTIRQHGFDVIELAQMQSPLQALAPTQSSSDYSAWLGASWQEDIQQFSINSDLEKWDLLVVDHYAIDHCWESAARPMCRRLMVIDDLANRRHDCDVLLDQNPGRRSADYRDLVANSALIYAGASYFLLRSEFQRLKASALARRQSLQVSSLLMTYGGVDKAGYTLRAMQVLLEHPTVFATIKQLNIVLGSHCPWIDQIKALASHLPMSAQILVNSSSMAQVMAESDIGLGAGGVAALERVFMHLPSLNTAVAANQVPGLSHLNRLGACAMLDSESQFEQDLLASFEQVLAPTMRQQLQDNCAELQIAQLTPRLVENLVLGA